MKPPAKTIVRDLRRLPPELTVMSPFTTLRTGDALIVVDIQNDFLPGGALAVPRGDEVVPVLNRYLQLFAREYLPVFATRDWHPADHSSFRSRGGIWPSHCVMDTEGAAFPASLALPDHATVISKADGDREAYSGFDGTALDKQLREAGVKRLFVGGLASDYCVLQTVRDAVGHGYDVFLLRDAIRAVNVNEADGPKAEAEMSRLGATAIEIGALEAGGVPASALLTDLYQLTMLRGYFAAAMEETAVFEFYVRRMPADWNFLVAAGLEQLIAFLETFRFAPDELEWLQRTGDFTTEALQKLAELRFTGDVHAMPEGTIFFPDEPIVRVTAPLPQAQIIETRLINLLHFQTLIASKAARSVLAAPGKNLVEFGLRRTHGFEAGLLAARACYLAGFGATSNVLARRRWGIPWGGTMAHSFVQAFASEEEAFLQFARANPEHVVLLIDTYDTAAAAAKVVKLAPVLRAEGIQIKGVRIDSGDLAAHAQRVRRILDEGGLPEVTIFASGNIDEHALARLNAPDVPIDGFGVGTRVTTSADRPYLDSAYKLQVYAGEPRRKYSEGKATWPGAKQVYRKFAADGSMESDTIALASERFDGEALLECVMREGRRISEAQPLAFLQARGRQQFASLPHRLRALTRQDLHPVYKSTGLRAVATELGLLHAAGSTGPRQEVDAPHRKGILHRIYRDGDPSANDDEASIDVKS